MLESGLSMKLRRTKTTGAGKKVRDLAAFVPSEAWVEKEFWLVTGYDLWFAVGDQ